MIKNKISLNKVIFIFFFVIVFIVFISLLYQYKNSKEILIQSYINKYTVQTLEIKSKFKNVFDNAFYVFKSHEQTDIKKLYLFKFLYEPNDLNLTKIAKVLNSDVKIGHYELFIIDKNYKIIKGTYKPDVGYDLGKYKAFRKVLDSVFQGKKEIDISPISLDVASMNLKKYYLIRSPDKKYLLQIAYVVDIYHDLKKVYDFAKSSFAKLDIYFINRFLIYHLNLKSHYYKKIPVNILYQNSLKIFKEMLDCNKKIDIKENKILLKNISLLFKKNKNIIKKLNFNNNSLTIYTLTNSIFEQIQSKLIIRTVYDISDLNKALNRLYNDFLFIFVFLVLVFVLLYIGIIYRTTKTIIKLVDHMKKNEPCDDCNSFIKEIDELNISYNTLHHKLNREIEKNKNLLELNRRFIVDTIHQIRTPLNIILLNVDLLKMDLKDKYKDTFDEIDAAVAMLTNSYEDLAYLSSDKAVVYKPDYINISEVLEKRVNFFNTIAKVNDKKLITDIDQNIEYYINQIEYERIVDNNISNAIKYSNKEEIFIELKKEKDFIVLRFKSFGKRIEGGNKVFEKNYREHAHKRGLGLGLNIVKNICQKYAIKYNVYYKDGMNVFEYIFKL